MSKDLHCIMLIDDDTDDNFYHEREIKKNNPENIVVTKSSGIEALEYIKSKKADCAPPDLIFLDINMPRMNGWEFLDEYHKLDKELQSGVVIIMLTTSGNPDDIKRARELDFVADYITKPLTKETMHDIADKYFNKAGIKNIPFTF